MELVSWLVS